MDECRREVVIEPTVVDLWLRPDGSRADDHRAGACKLIAYRLPRERIVPFAASLYHPGTEPGPVLDFHGRGRLPVWVRRQFHDLGSLVAVNGTFFDSGPDASHHPFGPYLGVDWEVPEDDPGDPGDAVARQLRRTGYFRVDHRNEFDFFGLFTGRSSSGRLGHRILPDNHFGEGHVPPGSQTVLARLGGGRLIVGPQFDALVEAMVPAHDDDPGLPEPPVRFPTHEDGQDDQSELTPAVNAYRERYEQLNKGLSWVGAQLHRLKARTLVAECRGSMYLLFLVSPDPSDNPSRRGYTVPNLAYELRTRFSCDRVILFDGGSRAELATREPVELAGHASRIWGGRSSTPTVLCLIAPRMIRWRRALDADLESTPRPVDDVRVSPPGEDSALRLRLLNAHAFGPRQRLRLRIESETSGRETFRDWELDWPADDASPVDLDVPVGALLQQESLPFPLVVTARTSDRFGFEYDCWALRLVLRGPARIGFVIDDSGSMQESDPSFLALSAVRRLALVLLEAEGAGPSIDVVRFTEQAESITDGFSRDPATVLGAASRSHFGHSGGTSLGAGLAAALDSFGPAAPERREVVLLTDGRDPGFSDEVVEEIGVAGVRVHTVGLGAEANGALLQRIASRTGGSYRHGAHVGDLLSIFGELTRELAPRAVVAASGLEPDPAATFTAAGSTLTATLVTQSREVDLASIFVTSPGQPARSLQELLAAPPDWLDVRVDDEHGVGADLRRVVVIRIDGETAPQGEFRIEDRGADWASMTVVEDESDAPRHTLRVDGPPEAGLTDGDPPFEVEIEWIVAGRLAEPAGIDAVVLGGGLPLEVPPRRIATGRYRATVDPAELSSGTYQLRVRAWAEGGRHMRQRSASLRVLEAWDLPLPDLPARGAAEESLYYELEAPPPAADGGDGTDPTVVTLGVELAGEVRSASLPRIGSRDGNEVFRGLLDLGPVAPAEDGRVRVTVQQGGRLARAESSIDVVGSRGAWVLAADEWLAVDVAGRIHGRVPAAGTAAIDDEDGRLWLVGGTAGEWRFRSFDRRGAPAAEIVSDADEVLGFSAYGGSIASFDVYREGGTGEARLVLRDPESGAVASHPIVYRSGASVLMTAPRAAYAVVGVEGFAGDRGRIDELIGEELRTLREGVSVSDTRLIVTPAGAPAYWRRLTGAPLRDARTGEALSPELRGSAIGGDEFGFWLLQAGGADVPPGLIRYEEGEDGFERSALITPEGGAGELLAVSRKSGVAFAVGRTDPRRLLLVEPARTRVVAFDAPIGGILAPRSHALETLPYVSAQERAHAAGSPVHVRARVRAAAGVELVVGTDSYPGTAEGRDTVFALPADPEERRYHIVADGSPWDTRTTAPEVGSRRLDIREGLSLALHQAGPHAPLVAGRVDVERALVDELLRLPPTQPNLWCSAVHTAGRVWWVQLRNALLCIDDDANRGSIIPLPDPPGALLDWSVATDTVWALRRRGDGSRVLDRWDGAGTLTVDPGNAASAIAATDRARCLVFEPAPDGYATRLATPGGVSEPVRHSSRLTAPAVAVGGAAGGWLHGTDRTGRAHLLVPVDTEGRPQAEHLTVRLQAQSVVGAGGRLWGLGADPGDSDRALHLVATRGSDEPPASVAVGATLNPRRRLGISAGTDRCEVIAGGQRTIGRSAVLTAGGELRLGPVHWGLEKVYLVADLD